MMDLNHAILKYDKVSRPYPREHSLTTRFLDSLFRLQISTRGIQ
jgi:hypothetical protein